MVVKNLSLKSSVSKRYAAFSIFGSLISGKCQLINLSIGNPSIRSSAEYFKAIKELLSEMEIENGNPFWYMPGKKPYGMCSAFINRADLKRTLLNKQKNYPG